MKLCGKEEKCFEKGECWGHLQGVMCKYLGENSKGSICLKTKELVKTYFTKQEKLQVENK